MMRMILPLCLALAAVPAVAQTLVPPPGTPKPPAAAPAGKAAPPKAAPVTGVQQVAPFASPMPTPSVLGHSAPGQHPPVVQPAHNLHAKKVEAHKPAAAPAPTAEPAKTEAAKPDDAAKPDAKPEQARPDPAKIGSGLPLPRFAALRSDEVFLRVGPGTRYPVDWVYHRRDLPVEIEREFEVWRLVQDQDGTKGWVHQATLTGRRSFVVKGAERTLRKSASDDATPVALLKPGVIGRIRGCEAGKTWCDMQVGDYRGWLKRDEVWGTYPGEAVN